MGTVPPVKDSWISGVNDGSGPFKWVGLGLMVACNY